MKKKTSKKTSTPESLPMELDIRNDEGSTLTTNLMANGKFSGKAFFAELAKHKHWEREN